MEKIKNYLSITNIGFKLKELYSELNNAFIILNDKKEYASHFYKRMDTELEEPYWRIKLVSEKMFNMVESLKFNEKDKKIEKYYNVSILKKINNLIDKDMVYRRPVYQHLTRIEPLTTTFIDDVARTSNYNTTNLNSNSNSNSNSNDILQTPNTSNNLNTSSNSSSNSSNNSNTSSNSSNNSNTSNTTSRTSTGLSTQI